jgi:hypothetical protein
MEQPSRKVAAVVPNLVALVAGNREWCGSRGGASPTGRAGGLESTKRVMCNRPGRCRCRHAPDAAVACPQVGTEKPVDVWQAFEFSLALRQSRISTTTGDPSSQQRLTAEKGPEAAIRIARGAKMPLRIAAKVPRGERNYFKEKLEPEIDGAQVQLTGEVNDEAKRQFLAGAAALLFPIDWPEPFGLVMIEAMACGTPVIAFKSGSVPEVIDDRITGFVVPGEAEAVEAIGRLSEFDRRKVRTHFEKRFTARRMAEEYLHSYKAVVRPDAAKAHPGIRFSSAPLSPPDRLPRP